MTIGGSVCTGRGTLDGDHCCYVAGEVCRYLTRVDERWRCGLMLKLGSWEKVHAHRGYQRYVQAEWDKVGIVSCGSWQPGPGECCREG